MRWSRLIIATGAFTLGLLGLAGAYAASNVLLPSSDDGSPASLPNLGLMPEGAAPAPAAAESSTPALLPKTDSSATTPSPPPPPPAAVKAAPYTPIPATMGTVSASFATRVIKLQTPQTVSNPAQANLPKSVSVAIAEYPWGKNDARIIQSHLGLPPDQMQQHCHLSIGGMLASDKGVYFFDTGIAAARTVLRYDGKPSSATIRMEAICDMGPLPLNAGYVFQIGDKYSVPLGQTTCTPPPPKLQRILFHYAGNGAGECQYQ